MEKAKKPTEYLPLGHNLDVRYRPEMADSDDLEAKRRAKEADRRVSTEEHS